MKEVAIVGIQGVPARYGGFETLVDNLLDTEAYNEIHYTVFCSSRAYQDKQCEYKHASLRYLPFNANGIQSTLYDILSMLNCGKAYDAVLILGVSGCIFLPIFRLFYKKRVIVNIDGLEHRRAKWGWLARHFLLASERMAVKYANVIVSDNKGIQNYVSETYHVPSELIAYGGNQVLLEVTSERQNDILKEMGLTPDSYCLSICRIEPENNCEEILKAFVQNGRQLVMVGNFHHSRFSRQLETKYESYPNIRMFNSIFDKEVLYCLRNNCKCYIHGHSAGGTNPSLVEAMFFGKNILAFDVEYNRFSTGEKAIYWKNAEELSDIVSSCKIECGKPLLEMAQKDYTWKTVVGQYENILLSSTLCSKS